MGGPVLKRPATVRSLPGREPVQEVRIQSPRHLRLVVTTGYGKPFLFTFLVLGTLGARIEPETAPKSRRPTTTCSLNAHCRSHAVCSTRPNRSMTCDEFSSASRRFSWPLIRDSAWARISRSIICPKMRTYAMYHSPGNVNLHVPEPP